MFSEVSGDISRAAETVVEEETRTATGKRMRWVAGTWKRRSRTCFIYSVEATVLDVRMKARNSVFYTGGAHLLEGGSILHPQSLSSILHLYPPSSIFILHPPSSIPHPLSSVLHPQSSILLPPFSFLSSQSKLSISGISVTFDRNHLSLSNNSILPRNKGKETTKLHMEKGKK